MSVSFTRVFIGRSHDYVKDSVYRDTPPYTDNRCDLFISFMFVSSYTYHLYCLIFNVMIKYFIIDMVLIDHHIHVLILVKVLLILNLIVQLYGLIYT